jgi:hypothetical protein
MATLTPLRSKHLVCLLIPALFVATAPAPAVGPPTKPFPRIEYRVNGVVVGRGTFAAALALGCPTGARRAGPLLSMPGATVSKRAPTTTRAGWHRPRRYGKWR